MLWGMTLKPGVSYTKVLDEEVHLSLASMESREQFGRIWPGSYAQVVMKTEDVEFLLCTLVHGTTFQQTLDLKLMPKEKITFTAYGESIIYISGYSSSGPRIHKVRSAIHRVIDGAISPNEEASLTNDKEIEESSWIPDDQVEEQKERTCIQVRDEEEQDCIEVMSYEEAVRVKKEPLNSDTDEGAVLTGTDNGEEYSVMANIASYAQESLMAAVQRYTVAEMHETENDGGNTIEGQSMTNTGPVPTSLTKVESSSKENGITRTHSSSFAGSSQLVGTIGTVSVARTRIHSGSSHPSQTNLSDNHHSLHVQEGSDAAGYVFSVSGSPIAVPLNPISSSHPPPSAVSEASGSKEFPPYTPRIKVKIDRDSRRSKSKKKSHSAHKAKSLTSRSGKQYRCRYCQKTFMHAHSMVRHERIHTGIKPYQCRICFKKFSDIGNKAKHERTHTGGRGFDCGYCGRTFTSYDSHRKHVKSCIR